MIYKHELRSNLKSLILWTVIMTVVDFGFMIMFPSMEDALDQAMDAYSNMGAFTQAFGMDKIGLNTPNGFYATYIGIMFCIGGSIFAAITGIGMLAKEEGNHTGEFLYTLPVSRKKAVLLKLAAVYTIMTIFSVSCYLVDMVSFVCIGEKVPFEEITKFHGAQLMMQLEIASVAYFISAMSKKVNISAGLGIALILYFCDMMLRVIDDISFLKFVTPFYYANASDIFSGSQAGAIFYIIGIIVTIVGVVGATVYYDRKNLAA